MKNKKRLIEYKTYQHSAETEIKNKKKSYFLIRKKRVQSKDSIKKKLYGEEKKEFLARHILAHNRAVIERARSSKDIKIYTKNKNNNNTHNTTEYQFDTTRIESYTQNSQYHIK